MAETIFYRITTKPFPLLALIKQKRLSVLYVFLLKDAFGMDCLKNYYNIMRNMSLLRTATEKCLNGKGH